MLRTLRQYGHWRILLCFAAHPEPESRDTLCRFEMVEGLEGSRLVALRNAVRSWNNIKDPVATQNHHSGIGNRTCSHHAKCQERIGLQVKASTADKFLLKQVTGHGTCVSLESPAVTVRFGSGPGVTPHDNKMSALFVFACFSATLYFAAASSEFNAHRMIQYDSAEEKLGYFPIFSPRVLTIQVAGRRNSALKSGMWTRRSPTENACSWSLLLKMLKSL